MMIYFGDAFIRRNRLKSAKKILRVVKIAVHLKARVKLGKGDSQGDNNTMQDG